MENHAAQYLNKIAFDNKIVENFNCDGGIRDDNSLGSLSTDDNLDGCRPMYTDGEISPSTASPLPMTKPQDLEVFFRDPGHEIHDIRNLGSVPKFVASRIDGGFETGSFLVTNLTPIINQYRQWVDELPMVQPFFAVKCNPDPVTVRLLATLGCGFDCATLGEMEMVLNGLGKALSFGPRGLAQTSLIYSHPAKMISHLEYALANDIVMTVFDGEDELYKIASLPGKEKFQVLLRLATDDKHSVCRFSKKFGANVREAPHLLGVAKSLGINVIGVHFHVGSGCGDGNAYVTALQHARWVFDIADSMGLPPMTMVDMGGGFPGDTGGYGGPGMPTFQNLAADIRAGIDMFAQGFARPMSSVRFVAEPGRYFVSAGTTIATMCYSRKGGSNPYQALYVNDGVYGSFNNVVYDHATPVPKKLNLVLQAEDALRAAGAASVAPVVEEADAVLMAEAAHLMLPLEEDGTAMSMSAKLTAEDIIMKDAIPTAIFGPTCDGLDQMCSLESTLLPRVEVGDWLIWENQGAYTHTASFVFNGFTHIPKRTYCLL